MIVIKFYFLIFTLAFPKTNLNCAETKSNEFYFKMADLFMFIVEELMLENITELG